MNTLQRMLTGISILTALAGCSATDSRPTITYKQFMKSPGCYNLFDYNLVSDGEASNIRGSSEKEYLEANKHHKRNMLPFNRR